MNFGFNQNLKFKTVAVLIWMNFGFHEDLKFRTNGVICFFHDDEIGISSKLKI